MSRPESKNVFYFPHYVKSNRELELIEYKHGSEGYKSYYKLLEMVADADYHRLSLKTQDDKDMFELGMKCEKKVVDDVIRILLNRGRIDKESWENEEIIWMQDFVETLKPHYNNRRKDLPTKDGISTSRNKQKRKEKKTKEKKTREKKKPMLMLSDYEKLFPDKDVELSLDKYELMNNNTNHDDAMVWLGKEKRLKKLVFKKVNGNNIAYCSECNKQLFPSDYDLQLKSVCCNAPYVPNKVNINKSRV